MNLKTLHQDNMNKAEYLDKSNNQVGMEFAFKRQIHDQDILYIFIEEKHPVEIYDILEP